MATQVVLPTLDGNDKPGQVATFIKQAQAGDPVALEALTRVLDRQSEKWRTFGDVAAQAQAAQIQLACGDDPLTRRGYERTLGQMRAELAQPGDGALERLLIERILTCWLQLGYADALAAQQAGQVSIEWADYFLKRIDRAHRRLLTATKTLATVRRLAQPAVQFNVGENQVNIAAGPVERPRQSA
jgi:hypothetical protein